jgi:hypothetical protein
MFKNVLKSIGLVFGAGIFQYILALVVAFIVALMGVEPFKAGFYGTAVFMPILVAPIVEEWLKRHTLRKGYGWVFFWVLNVLEFTSYTLNMLIAGKYSFPAILVMRTLAVGMHGGTMYLHIKDHKNGLWKAMVFHGVYNALGILYVYLTGGFDLLV